MDHKKKQINRLRNPEVVRNPEWFGQVSTVIVISKSNNNAYFSLLLPFFPWLGGESDKPELEIKCEEGSLEKKDSYLKSDFFSFHYLLW